MTDTLTIAEWRAEQAAAMLERDLQNAVRDLALANNAFFYHTWNSQKSAAGFPDCIIIPPLPDNRIIVAELKREGKHPTDAQYKWLFAFGRCADDESPVEVHIWRPLDLLDGTIEAVLRGEETT